MSKFCEICGKGPVAGRSITQRGMAKKKGGVGRKTTGITKRVFRPNLQNIKITNKGTNSTAKVCTSCIRSGKITKAS
ncbi:MAG: 50S ribosomal protein L28 [Candidatus Omnitrophica bacterium]|nr:50S ribosomal protein L28 [Candidatus Omnitrophota bacterium]